MIWKLENMRERKVTNNTLLVWFCLILLTFSSGKMTPDKVFGLDHRGTLSDNSGSGQNSLREGQCPDILGCATCDDSGNCSQCVDEFYAQITGNQCACIFDDMTFNKDGQCVFCQVPGCKVCDADGIFSYTCHECLGTAEVNNLGQCECPGQNQFLIQGRCMTCPGTIINGQCVMCNLDNCVFCFGTTCAMCTDPTASINQFGSCVCPGATQFHDDGYCGYCYASGCHTCEGGTYVSNRCAECIDENATALNGVCTCPNSGEGVLDDGYCGSCPGDEIIISGSCVVDCQDSLGCSDCVNGACSQCLDYARTILLDNQCNCIYTGASMRQDGTCGYCWVPGCKYCSSEDYISFDCVECEEGLALDGSGKCTCSDGQYIVDGSCQACADTVINGQCRTCTIDNCLSCQGGSSTCDQCIDVQFAEVNNEGNCFCRYEGETFNEHGYCVECYAVGCRTCEADDFQSYRCFECVDDSASVIDGKCVCPDGQGLQYDGYCTTCNAVGCQVCADGSVDTCRICVGAPQAYVNDEGQCECPSGTNMNEFGFCEDCSVEGCEKCQDDDQNACEVCIDVDNTNIEDGQCVCTMQLDLNDEGYCQECDVVGCASCKTGDSSDCDRCETGLNEDGKTCECPSMGEKIDQNGDCSACEVLGCQSCRSNDATSCRSCYEGAYLINNECYCIGSLDAPNEKGKCSSCFISGCISCSSSDPYECLQCADDFTLENNVCQCQNQGEKINIKGVCEVCNVEGCQSCEEGNSNTCAKCSDCDAFLVDGQCVCPDGEAWSPSLSQCAVVTVANSQQPDRFTKECSAGCQECKLGFCSKCFDGFYLNKEDNQCIKCNPRCKTCADETSCIIHQEGWTTQNGEIKHCDVLHCADCSKSAEVCTKCKQNYLQVDQKTCEAKNSITKEISFEEFKKAHNKTYESPEEEEKRKEIYYRNYEKMMDLRADDQFEWGSNSLLDRTEEEIQGLTGYKYNKEKELKSATRSIPLKADPPTSMSWVTKGAVTPIRDQGSCGSCWAFGAVAGAESTLILKGEADLTIDLSEQYLTECTPESGCDGTYDVNKVMIVTKSGLPTEAQFPYIGQGNTPGICQASNKVRISDTYTEYLNLSDEEIIALLQDGPLVCTLSATDWEYYSSGIFSCSASAQINHVVQLVGYQPDYWLIKNQWGTGWGEQGYIRITRSRSGRSNCYIGTEFFRHDREIRDCEVTGCVDCTGDATRCVTCHQSATYNQNDNVCECRESGHLMMDSGECVPCEVFGCQQCQDSNPSACAACHSSMTPSDDGSCVCTDPTHKFTKEGTCVLCEAVGCEYCQDGEANVCTKCLDCSAFIQAGECQCKEGFMMDQMGSCIRSSSTICTEPLEERDGKCQCPENLYEPVNAPQTCEECLEPKFLYQSQCVACLAGCRDCSSNPNLCEQCQDGYYPNDKFCYECPEGCLTCSSETVCGDCADTHEKEADLCVPLCNFPCQSCPNGLPDVCLSCVDGYNPSNMACTKAQSCVDSNCEHCPDSENVCKRCADGYEEFGGGCSVEGTLSFLSQQLRIQLEKNPAIKRKISQILKQAR